MKDEEECHGFCVWEQALQIIRIFTCKMLKIDEHI